MPCKEILTANNRTMANFRNFDTIHWEGKRLIWGWLDKAKQVAKDFPDKEEPVDYGTVFEGFIYLWIAFNGWGICVTGKDSDKEMIDILARDTTLDSKFTKILNEPNSQLLKYAEEFRSFWPIFDVRDIHKQKASAWDIHDRPRLISHYIAKGVTKYSPKCWDSEHHSDNQNIPLDWIHVLTTIYRVRCNLFHGRKSVFVDMDSQIVKSAFFTLYYFCVNGNILE